MAVSFDEFFMETRITFFYNDGIMLPTYRPHKRKRAKTIGFRARMKTAGGRNTLKRRRFKGRHKLTHKQP
jgi:large subunit ribosomal protein L34